MFTPAAATNHTSYSGYVCILGDVHKQRQERVKNFFQ